MNIFIILQTIQPSISWMLIFVYLIDFGWFFFFTTFKFVYVRSKSKYNESYLLCAGKYIRIKASGCLHTETHL